MHDKNKLSAILGKGGEEAEKRLTFRLHQKLVTSSIMLLLNDPNILGLCVQEVSSNQSVCIVLLP